MKMKELVLLIAIMFSACHVIVAQEENNVVYQAGKRYVDFNLRSLNKFASKVHQQQDRLLKKLCKQEKRFARRLKHKDSAGYAAYTQQTLTFDSLRKLSGYKDGMHIKAAQKPNSEVDSLRNITRFVSDKTGLEGVNSEDYNSRFTKLEKQLNSNVLLDKMIGQRVSFIRGINPKSSRGIDKNIFYIREKVKVLKAISEEPDKVEVEALELLQGQSGFEEALQGEMQVFADKDVPANDLERMGYQTKQQMQHRLQQKFGTNHSGLQAGMTKQIGEYQDKFKELENVKKAVRDTKQSAQNFKHTDMAAFRINPMRALPFGRRIEKQYNWQTTRATIDGKPAMFQFSVLAGFKHTPRLSYGVGVATSIGLGKDWNNIRFTFEGLGVRTYTQYKMIWGIAAYGGYERMFKNVVFTGKNANTVEYNSKESQHNTRQYSEAVMLGLTKDYRINDKWNGSLQLLYDVWWKEKGLRSPFQIRFNTMKN